MKWFKHLSGAITDNLIFEAIEKFGGDGYMVFFGTLELIADEFDVDNPGSCRLPIKKLTGIFQISRQKLTKILAFYDQKSKMSLTKDKSFSVCFDGNYVVIKCNRLASLCDEYTEKQLKKKSGECHDTNREFVGSKEVEVDNRDKIKRLKAEDPSVDNSPPEKDASPESTNGTGPEVIKSLIEKIAALKPDPHFNRQVMIFIETYLPQAMKKRVNIRTVIFALERMIEDLPTKQIMAPKLWLEKIMEGHDAAFQAEDFQAEKEDLHVGKQEAAAVMERLGNILASKEASH